MKLLINEDSFYFAQVEDGSFIVGDLSQDFKWNSTAISAKQMDKVLKTYLAQKLGDKPCPDCGETHLYQVKRDV